MNCDLLIIDGSYLAHRSYNAFKLTTSKGKPSNLIYSFLISLNSFAKKFNSTTTVVAWDIPGLKFRHKLYPNYKPSVRREEDFIEQLEVLQQLLYCLDISQYYSPGFEADDVIANLCFRFKDKVKLIFTVDKDIYQLVDEKTFIFDGKKVIDGKVVEEKFGVQPSYIPYLLAISGDVSDNIEGFKGYGYRKSAKVVNEFILTKKLPDGIDETKFKRNLQLTKLYYNCPLLEIKYNFNKKDRLLEILNEYELNTIKKKLDEFPKNRRRV